MHGGTTFGDPHIWLLIYLPRSRSPFPRWAGVRTFVDRLICYDSPPPGLVFCLYPVDYPDVVVLILITVDWFVVVPGYPRYYRSVLRPLRLGPVLFGRRGTPPFDPTPRVDTLFVVTVVTLFLPGDWWCGSVPVGCPPQTPVYPRC
jgi:hypothetical protein